MHRHSLAHTGESHSPTGISVKGQRPGESQKVEHFYHTDRLVWLKQHSQACVLISAQQTLIQATEWRHINLRFGNKISQKVKSQLKCRWKCR